MISPAGSLDLSLSPSTIQDCVCLLYNRNINRRHQVFGGFSLGLAPTFANVDNLSSCSDLSLIPNENISLKQLFLFLNRALQFGAQIKKIISTIISFAPQFEVRDFCQFGIARY